VVGEPRRVHRHRRQQEPLPLSLLDNRPCQPAMDQTLTRRPTTTNPPERQYRPGHHPQSGGRVTPVAHGPERLGHSRQSTTPPSAC